MKLFIVDSFTSTPFKGNPAGVCLTETETAPELMLAIANELGFSETAFVKRGSDFSEFSIRFFSPKREIPLCGHATLASAKVVFEQFDTTQAHFFNIQDLDLYVRKVGEEILMEFPRYSTESASAPPLLLNALGIDQILNCEFNRETNILLLDIPSSETLQSLSPDFDALKASHDSINGVLVTAVSSDPSYDFQSRYFWPWSGTNEDPVTGGTHTFLAPYWGLRLGKTKLKSYQCSKRGGSMEVELLSGSTVAIKSQAVILLSGMLSL